MAGKAKRPKDWDVKTLDVDADSFVINGENLRALYDACDVQLLQAAGIDADGECPDEIVPPVALQKRIVEHFKVRPFDKLSFGVLKIESKEKGLVWFEPNEEQREILEWLEAMWYAKKPVRFMILKARQIGGSTFCCGALYCLESTYSYRKTHLVADLHEKCRSILEIKNTFWEHEPEWVKPVKSKLVNPLTYDDEAKGIRKMRIYSETAERREKISRGLTFAFNHLSEAPYWPADYQAQIYSSLKKSVTDGWPSLIADEGTGYRMNDVFYNRYMWARDRSESGIKTFFFPWFKHAEYSRKLPDGMTTAMLKDSLNELDLAMMKQYKLTPEKIYWYTQTRDEELANERGSIGTLAEFKKEYPSCESDAFLGGRSNYFDIDRQTRDIKRNQDFRVTTLDKLLPSTSYVEQPTNIKFHYARCELYTDWESGFKNASFIDSKVGEWVIFEPHRKGHRYVVSADIASGKQKLKNNADSIDFSDVEVFRFTHEADERPCIVQVAQYRSRSTDPRELAKEAVGASVLYGDHETGQKALFIPEKNNEGVSTLDEAKRLKARIYQKVTYDERRTIIISSEYGFTTTGGTDAEGSKNRVCSQFRALWNMDMIQINSAVTSSEMGTFVNEDGKLKGMGSCHDDAVIGSVLNIEGIRQERNEVLGPEKVDLSAYRTVTPEQIPEAVREEPKKIDVQARLRSHGIPASKSDNKKAWGGETFDSGESSGSEIGILMPKIERFSYGTRN